MPGAPLEVVALPLPLPDAAAATAAVRASSEAPPDDEREL